MACACTLVEYPLVPRCPEGGLGAQNLHMLSRAGVIAITPACCTTQFVMRCDMSQGLLFTGATTWRCWLREGERLAHCLVRGTLQGAGEAASTHLVCSLGVLGPKKNWEGHTQTGPAGYCDTTTVRAKANISKTNGNAIWNGGTHLQACLLVQKRGGDGFVVVWIGLSFAPLHRSIHPSSFLPRTQKHG